MKRAQYPEKTCRAPVAGQYQMYTCELPEHEDDGPCASYSSAISVKAREAWERGQALRAARQAKAAKKKASPLPEVS